MTSSTYLRVNENLYKQGKIDILSARSSILLSRENAKRMHLLINAEKTYRFKVANSMNKIKLSLKKFIEELPKAKAPIPLTQKQDSLVKRNRPNANNDIIRDELAQITQKLQELGGL